ncbi:MAG: hypothetical protein H0X04_00175 [Chthoniobacterales bacterium]|nr:hypothetical protein [Chthoniobacterales bacterium]
MIRYIPRVVRKTTTPGVNDDKDSGYVIGDIWMDTTGNAIYMAESVANGAANWLQIDGTGGGGAPTSAQVMTALYHRAAVDPTVNDDTAYEVGHLWVNTVSLGMFRCDDNTNGAAVWTPIGAGSSASMVKVAATHATATVIATTTMVRIPWDTEVYDTGSDFVTGASAEFTAPTTGYYHVNLRILLASWAHNVNTSSIVELRVNGAATTPQQQIASEFAPVTGTSYVVLNGSVDIYLVASDTLSTWVYQDSGSSTTLHNAADWNRLSIHGPL